MKKNLIQTIHNTHNTTRKIRIIGGQWKGTKISTIQHPELRPTTNQIRETLFNWLTPVIIGANCLDCFAGTGALGLEALSRHANTATFLEINKKISKKITKTIQLLKIKKQTKVITINSNQWLITHSKKYKTKPYDIIFLDPPFSKWHYINNTIKLLEKSQYLSENAWIYIENKNTNYQKSTLTIPNTWKIYKKKTTGNVSYQIYIKNTK